MEEPTKISKSVLLDPSILVKVQEIAEKRDRSVHYILVELIEKNIDKPEHATEQPIESPKIN